MAPGTPKNQILFDRIFWKTYKEEECYEKI